MLQGITGCALAISCQLITLKIFDSVHIELKEDGETASLVSCILATDRPSFDLDLVNVNRQ